MSVPRALLLVARPSGAGTVSSRSSLTAVSYGRTAFTPSVRNGLHINAPILRRPLAPSAPTTAATAAILSSSPSVHTLNNNRPLQSTFRVTSLQYYSSSTHASNNDQKPPLFAAHSSYPNDNRVFFFDIDNCLYPKTSGIPHLMKARCVVVLTVNIDSAALIFF